MSSPEGILGSLNLGEILRSLLPDDDLPRHKYIRGFGARMVFFDLLIFFFVSMAQSYFDSEPILSYIFILLFFIAGFSTTGYGIHQGKEFEDINRREREAKVERHEKVNDAFPGRQVPVKERRSRNFKFSDEEMEVEVEDVTIEASDGNTDQGKDEANDPPSADEQDVEYEE